MMHTQTVRPISVLITLLVAAFSVLTSACVSAAPEASVSDPKAVLLFTQMTTAYAGLKSFTETIISRHTGDPQVVAQIALQRPGQAAYRSDNLAKPYPPVQIVVDGTYFYEVSNTDAKQYLQFRLPPGQDAFTTAASYAWGSGIDLCMFANTKDTREVITSLEKSVMTLGKPTRDDGVVVDTLILRKPATKTLVSEGATKIIFHIGHADHLMRRLEYQVVMNKDGPPKVLMATEIHQGIKANQEIPAKVFQFTPPPGRTAHHAFSFPMPEDPQAL